MEGSRLPHKYLLKTTPRTSSTMPLRRMTANPTKPARYRPGKPIADAPSSDEEDVDAASGDDVDNQTQPVPTASNVTDSTRIASSLKNVDLNERRRQADAQEALRLEAEKATRAKEEEGFVTEESDNDEEEESEDEGSNSEEESSSEEEAPKVLLRPTFIKKSLRKEVALIGTTQEDQKWAEDEARKKEKADALVQEQLERNAAARAAGKKNWDDDEDVERDLVDDTDGLDPEAELAAWKLRELKRVKREREAIELAEKEREEVERRRNLSKEEREAEDREFIDRQKEEQENKGKMGYLQKYYHKGAFFQDDEKMEGLDKRDIMASRYQDDVTNRELLPQYMQIRDMTKLGRKGRTKYKDLKSEDTGRWGQDDNRGLGRGDRFTDERFKTDRDGGGGKGASGANATEVRERRKAPEGAPEGPRNQTPRDHTGQTDSYTPDRVSRDDRYNNDRRRRRSHSRSGSPTPRRERRGDDRDRDRRKRSLSPYYDQYDSEKRRRVDVR